MHGRFQRHGDDTKSKKEDENNENMIEKTSEKMEVKADAQKALSEEEEDKEGAETKSKGADVDDWRDAEIESLKLQIENLQQTIKDMKNTMSTLTEQKKVCFEMDTSPY